MHVISRDQALIKRFEANPRFEEVAEGLERYTAAERFHVEACSFYKRRFAAAARAAQTTAAIIGATKMDQLKSDIAAVDLDLSDAVLDDIAETYKRFPMPL
mgnify:CR=1 FL=1